jgi:hypothetical protein
MTLFLDSYFPKSILEKRLSVEEILTAYVVVAIHSDTTSVKESMVGASKELVRAIDSIVVPHSRTGDMMMSFFVPEEVKANFIEKYNAYYEISKAQHKAEWQSSLKTFLLITIASRKERMEFGEQGMDAPYTPGSLEHFERLGKRVEHFSKEVDTLIMENSLENLAPELRPPTKSHIQRHLDLLQYKIQRGTPGDEQTMQIRLYNQFEAKMEEIPE